MEDMDTYTKEELKQLVKLWRMYRFYMGLYKDETLAKRALNVDLTVFPAYFNQQILTEFFEDLDKPLVDPSEWGVRL